MDSASDHSASLQNSVETLREDVSAVQNIVTELLTRFSSLTAPRKYVSCPLGHFPSAPRELSGYFVVRVAAGIFSVRNAFAARFCV